MERKMKIKRIFYPVGQGAFYREKIDGFNFVYDCGTKSGKDNIKKSIERFIEKENEKNIDLLIISHFDIDHYNGIKYLIEENFSIKKIMIPHWNEEIKLSNIIDILNDENSDSKDLKDSLKMILNPLQELNKIFDRDNIKIIQVLPSEKDIEDKLEEETIDYDNLADKISSGINITIEEKKLWIIKPFNLKLSTEDEPTKSELNELNKKLELELIDDDLNISNVLKKLFKNIDDDKFIEKIKSVYKETKLEKTVNKYSMCCYSGLVEDKGSLKIGCLYTGDYNAKDNIDSLLKFYTNNINSIGIIQIPHHGSVKDYTDKLILKNVKTALISAGLKNKYGHPSEDVVKSIAQKCWIRIVSEDKKSYYEKNYERFKGILIEEK